MGLLGHCPSLAGFEARQACTPSWALTTLPLLLEGGEPVDGGVQALPVGSALWEGWWSSQSTRFQKDVVFMSLLGNTFSERYRPVARPPRPPYRKGFCRCGWFVSPLPE